MAGARRWAPRAAFCRAGGFGSWPKKYGIAAAGLLDAEVVTADGKVIVASACQHPELWWALRGGGRGTFGVVTRATLMKRIYDPADVFTCHHCVGSEGLLP